jgi:hypothetical protein
MTDRPISFSSAMVRALLEGRKTMTRRIIKLPEWADSIYYDFAHGWRYNSEDHFEPCHLPYAVGDRLYVRESVYFSAEHQNHYFAADKIGVGESAHLALPKKSIPSIHMPRWASRITLTVTAVKVERLQDISEEDARAEGAEKFSAEHPDLPYRTCKRDFCSIWQSLNAKRAPWDSNPWICAVSFRVIHKNIDAIGEGDDSKN